MSSQPLPGLEPEARLTERQAYALAVIRERGPISSVELGAYDCERRGKHAHDEICEWDQAQGASLGRELARKGLVKRRRSEGWVVEGYAPPRGPSAQMGPDDPWPPGFGSDEGCDVDPITPEEWGRQ